MQIYQNHIDELKNKVTELTLQNQRLRHEMAEDVEKTRQMWTAQSDKDKFELTKLRGQQLVFQNQFPLIKEALVTVREMLNGLVPEDTYLRLKNLPGKDLNPNEWV
jgi:hypothetical protein